MRLKSIALCVLLLTLAFWAQAQQIPGLNYNQVPGINVNMVSGTTFPNGDPFLQRQNEPSLAVSTRNAMKLLGGANDYRTVDIPFPNDDGQETGDAWVGVFKSFDGGLTWRSTLLPGFPQDTSAAGMASPLKAYGTATDPTVRAGTHGLFYYSGLVLNRGTNGTSAVFVSTFQDRNNSSVNDTIGYLNTALIDTGNTGQFMDKPWMAVDVPRSGPVGSASCTIDGRTITSGNAYIFFTKFLGTRPSSNPHTQIFVSRSQDCGKTWSKPNKVSESYDLNQGTVAAIDPRNGDIHLAWRQLANGNDPDAIVYTVSRDGGQTFSKAAYAFVFPAGTAFDQQPSTGYSFFRTFSLPALAVGPTGRVFLAFSQLGKGPLGTARIMISNLEPLSSTWSTPYVADPTATGPGHQMLPTLTAAYGKIMLGFYDFREDNTKGVLRCPAGVNCTSVEQYREERVSLGDPDANVHARTVADETVRKRHTVDARASLVNASAAGNVPFPSVRVSQYLYGQRPGIVGPRQLEQLQFNPPNLPMFVKGKKGFIGDYIDSAALSFVVDASGNWVHNTATDSSAVFHFSWTDNRDVRMPPYVSCDSNGLNCVPCQPGMANCRQNWEAYTPPGSAPGSSLYDPTQQKVVCVPAAAGTRNQNVYAARFTEGLFVGVRENAKQLELAGGLTQRGYSVIVQNALPVPATYLLEYTLAGSVTASFDKLNANVPSVEVIIPARSSVARTLFVTSSSETQPNVKVRVTQQGVQSPRTPLTAVVSLNPDWTNPKAESPLPGLLDTSIPDNSLPDATNPSVNSQEVYNPTVVNPVPTVPDLSQPQILSPDILSPDILSPDILSPDILSPDIAGVQILSPDILSPDILSPDILSPDILSPDILSPDILSPDILSPDILSPDILSPDIAAPSDLKVTDLSWKVTNQGNVSESYNIKLLQQGNRTCCPARCTPGVNCPAGCFPCQLILRRAYTSPTNNGCSLVNSVQNQSYANVPLPQFTDPGAVGSYSNDRAANNPTVSLAPGEGVRATLRVYGRAGDPVPPSFGQPVAIAAGDPNGFRRSLTITTLSLPPAFVGTPYSGTGFTLQSIGGDSNPIRTWSNFNSPSLQLVPGISLAASTGVISGTPTASGSTPITFQVKDSPAPPVQPHMDTQLLNLDVNNFAVSGIQVYRTGGVPGDTGVQPGGSINVTLTVSNQGPSTLQNIQVFATVGGTTFLCTGPAPGVINGTGTLQVTVTCGPINATGPVTIGVRAQGTVLYAGQSINVSTATDSSGVIYVDNTPPTLSVSALAGGQPYTAGAWATQDVTVTFTCTDAESGIPVGGTPIVTTISVDTSGTTVPGTCTDRAGNTASGSFLVRLDKTKPTITPTATVGGQPYTAGTWTRQDVVVTFTCTDTGSGIPAGSGTSTTTVNATTPAPGQTVNGSCTDAAGNTNTATFLASVDKTLPGITAAALSGGQPYSGNGAWAKSDVTVTFTCSDGASGLSGSPETSVTVSNETAGQTVTGTCTDTAGNVATLDFLVKLDKTAPGISPSASSGGQPYSGNGAWAKSDVAVTFACTDLGSGLPAGGASKTVNVTAETPAAGQTVTGTCTDVAGNTSPVSSFLVKLDKTAPVVTLTTPASGASYVPGSTVTVSYSCTDALSGMGTCNAPQTSGATLTISTTLGAASYTVTATDQAGNIATKTNNYTVGYLYRFFGFGTPLVTAGTISSPTYSGAFNFGKAIPVKWDLKDTAGAPLTDLTSLKWMTAVQNTRCAGPAPAGAPVILLYNPTTGATGGSTFRGSGGSYIFNWDTNYQATRTCYNLILEFKDTQKVSTIVKLQ